MRVRAAVSQELPSLARRFGLGRGWARRAGARADHPDARLLLVEDDRTCVALLDARIIEPRTARGAIPEIVRRFRTCHVSRLLARGDVPQSVGLLVAGLNGWLRERRVRSAEIAVASEERAVGDALAGLGLRPSRFLYVRAPLDPGSLRAMATDGISLREATQADLGPLARLVREEIELQRELAGGCFELVDDVDWSAYVAARLACPGIELLVAVSQGQPLGYLELQLPRPRRGIWPRLLGGRRPAASGPGVIEDIFVDGRARRSGCGEALVARALQRMARAGVDEALAGIWAGNEPSLRFFERVGFVRRSVVLRGVPPD